MRTLCKGWMFMAVLLANHGAFASDLTGRYVAEDASGAVLELQESANGDIFGTLSAPGQSLSLRGRRQGVGFAGAVGSGSESVSFVGAAGDGRIVLEFGAAAGTMAFRKERVAATAATPATAGTRHVEINGQVLTDLELMRIESAYRIRIPDANYWYDPVLGAWGAKGGPTMGFLPPGLALGGPLRPDASGGGTAVFVNGRALHPYDLMALQQITGPILPGRYFITAQGLAGYEGGPPLWNLAALAARSQGGGSNTWQSRVTGASGFSDGTTGAVFLPNGGIVSTGQ